MLKVRVEFYCDCCGTRIDGTAFFNVILGNVYHYHDECFVGEICPDTSKEQNNVVIPTKPDR